MSSRTRRSGRRNNCPQRQFPRKMRFSSSWHFVISAFVYSSGLCLTQFSPGEGISDTSGPLEFRDILPEDPRTYDKMQPPKENGAATEVYFHVTVMSLDSIDEGSMTYAADIFFAQSWKDYRLRLPDGNLTSSNTTSGYRLLPVSWLEGIWRPDSFFKNAKKVTFQEMTIPNHYIWLHQDKTILYMVKLTLVLSCAMNFQRYPHDTQKCSIKIESLSYTTNDLRFEWEKLTPLVVDSGIELPQFDIIDNVTGDCTQTYSTGNFTCLEVIFTFRRRLGYFLFHTYVPTCLIVIMSWISFWIKPEAVPARVTLGVTSLLTLSTQHANSQKSLPPVSYIKGIDFFMSSCTVFVFFSLMEYAVVNVVLGDLVDSDESYMRRGLRQISRRVTRRSRGTLSAQSSTAEFPLNEIPEGALVNKAQQCFANGRINQARQLEVQRCRDRAIFIDRFSSIFFPASFGVLNLIYWGIFMEWF